MNEELIVSNALIYFKHLKAFLATFSQEASNEELMQLVDDAYCDITNKQRELYTFMSDNNYVKVTYQNKTAIEKLYKKFEKKSCNA